MSNPILQPERGSAFRHFFARFPLHLPQIPCLFRVPGTRKHLKLIKSR